MTRDGAAVERWTDRVRGLMLGLALGESVGRGNHRQDLIRAGVSTQLAAFMWSVKQWPSSGHDDIPEHEAHVTTEPHRALCIQPRTGFSGLI